MEYCLDNISDYVFHGYSIWNILFNALLQYLLELYESIQKLQLIQIIKGNRLMPIFNLRIRRQ